MKKLSFIACVLLVLASCNQNSGGKTTLKTSKDSFSYAFGAYSGGMLHRFKVSEVNWEVFKAAMEEGLAKGDSGVAFDRETIGRILNEYTIESQFGVNRKTGQEYIDKRKSEGFTATPSGLLYRQIKAGNGVKPNITDTVLVHYTGKLPDGTVFDSNEGKEAFKTSVSSGAIKGFLEALSMMDEGSSAEIIIPWELGYGAEGSRNPYTGDMSIEPYTTLTFMLTLDSIQK